MRVAVVVIVLVSVLGMVIAMPTTRERLAAPVEASGPAISGDINCDASVTADDVLAGMRSLAGLNGAGCANTAGDVDCSGQEDMSDVLLIRDYLADLEVTLPSNCPLIGSPVPTSNELINAALSGGFITEGEALLYHLYADLTPDSLPAEYHGANSNGQESAIFQDIAANWGTLPPDEQSALRPFLMPPASPGSWYEGSSNALTAQSVQWETVGNDNFKVWWEAQRPEDAAKAAALLDEMTDYIWPQELNYMGHQPLSDAGYPNSGGDGRFDIYLAHNPADQPGEMPALGYVSSQLTPNGGYACKSAAAFMVLNSRVALSPELYATMSHEFMHAIQFGYNIADCSNYLWMMESTATWTESWLYPDVNLEHGFANSFLGDLQSPLEKRAYMDLHQYGSYLWWYFLEKKANLFYAVRDAWNSSSNPDSLQAVKLATASAGDFNDLWARSALYNWNRPPYDDFLQIDDLIDAAPFKDTEVQVTNTPVTYTIPTALGHMGQDHFHYRVDDSVKSLTFINPFVGSGEQDVKIQALVEIGGIWESVARDWTDSERESFCLEKPDEKVEELVIILTNSSTDRSHTFDVDDAKLVASPVSCSGWVGSAHAVVRNGGTTWTMDVENLRFERPTDPPDNPADNFDIYTLVQSGTATWYASGGVGDCAASGSMTLADPGQPGGAYGFIMIYRATNTYDIMGSGHVDGATFTYTCGDAAPGDAIFPYISFINKGTGGVPMVDEDGTLVLDGTYTDPKESYGGTWSWRLVPEE